MKDENWYRQREKMREMGIPVGVGMPEQQPEEHMVEDIAEQQDGDYTQAMAEQAIAMGDMANQGGYSAPYIDNEKAKIIDFINRLEPQERNQLGEVISGEIPKEVMFDKGLYPFFAHNSTMSNLDEHELRMMRAKFKTAANAAVGAMKRGSFTPDKFAYFEGAEAMAFLRLNQNKGGQERYFSGVEAQDTHHSYSVSQKKSIKENLKRALNR